MASQQCIKSKDEEIDKLKSQVNLLANEQTDKIKSFEEERAAFEEYKMEEKAVIAREYLMLDEEWGEIWDKRRESIKTDEDIVADDAEMLLKEPTEAGVDANCEIVSKDLKAKNSKILDLTENVDKAEESPTESAKIRRRGHVAEDKLEEAVSKNSVSSTMSTPLLGLNVVKVSVTQRPPLANKTTNDIESDTTSPAAAASMKRRRGRPRKDLTAAKKAKIDTSDQEPPFDTPAAAEVEREASLENEADDIQIVYKGRGSLRPRYSEVKEENLSQGFKDLMAEVDNIIGTNQEGSVESATLPADCDVGATNEYTLEELMNEPGDSSLE